VTTPPWIRQNRVVGILKAQLRPSLGYTIPKPNHSVFVSGSVDILSRRLIERIHINELRYFASKFCRAQERRQRRLKPIGFDDWAPMRRGSLFGFPLKKSTV
jgi:hypothetical protein